MKLDLAVRSHVSNFISRHENVLRRILGAAWTLFGVSVVSGAFGFSDLLSSVAVRLLLTVAGFFLPSSGIAVMLVIYMVLQVLSLSQSIGILVFFMFAVFYIFCYSYKARFYNMLPGIAIFYRASIPYVGPMVAGLFGGYHEVTSVIGGSVIAYYLKTVHDAIPSISEGSDGTGALDLLSTMVSGSGFYFFIASMIVLFLAVCTIKNLRVSYSWIIAVIGGTIAEMLIMFGGVMFFGQGPEIWVLIGGNIVSLLVGILCALLFRNLDFSRVERVQFEDDDYYYYVTAVPKIHIAEEDKEIKKITSGTEEKSDEKEVNA